MITVTFTTSIKIDPASWYEFLDTNKIDEADIPLDIGFWYNDNGERLTDMCETTITDLSVRNSAIDDLMAIHKQLEGK